MTNPTAAATTPVKSLPAARPRAPPEFWLPPVVLEGRGEDEVPVVLGGVEERGEEEAGDGFVLVGPIGKELAPSICC